MQHENNKNMEIWNYAPVPEAEYTKNFDKGSYGGTTTNATYLIKKMTEIFGPMGKYWGVKNEKFQMMPEQNLCIYTALLFYISEEKECIIEMHSDINLKFNNGKNNNDITKKLATDALSKALSKLGFSSSIFMGEWDDNKHVQELQNEMKHEKEFQEYLGKVDSEEKAGKLEGWVIKHFSGEKQDLFREKIKAKIDKLHP